MPVQKTMHFFGQLAPNSFSRRYLVDARFAESIDRTKFSQQQILSVLTDAWTIIENTFVNSLLQQQLMISIREPVRFVADSLQQVQRARIDRQLQWHRSPGPINLLVLFRQTDDRQIVQAESL